MWYGYIVFTIRIELTILWSCDTITCSDTTKTPGFIRFRKLKTAFIFTTLLLQTMSSKLISRVIFYSKCFSTKSFFSFSLKLCIKTKSFISFCSIEEFSYISIIIITRSFTTTILIFSLVKF